MWRGGLPQLPGVPHLHVNRPLFCLSYKFFLSIVGRGFASNNASKENNIENETAANKGELGVG